MLGFTMFTRRSFLASSLLPLAWSPSHASIPSADLSPIIVGFRGTKAGDLEVDAVCEALAKGLVCGVILLRRNIVSPDQVLKLTLALRNAASGFVPIISLDQEGGLVARLDQENGFTEWASAAETAFMLRSETELYDYFLLRAREVSSVGLNMNFGPVLDLNVNPLNPIIGSLDRSYGNEPSAVLRCAAAFVRAHRDAGVLTCVKHFPGHGSSVADSHLETTDINETWSEIELEPFQTMAKFGFVDAIMTSHQLHRRFSDGRNVPVSLSRTATDEIRSTLGFEGAIFTDDLQMKSISTHYSEADAAVTAVRAGATFLVYANHKEPLRLQKITQIKQSIDRAFDGTVSEDLERSNRANLAADFVGRLS